MGLAAQRTCEPPWGFPSWIDEKQQDATELSLNGHEDHEGHPEHNDGDQASQKLQARLSMTSLLKGFQSTRLLSEASISTALRTVDEKQQTTASTLTAKDIALLACLGDSLLTGLCVTAQPLRLKNRLLHAALTSIGRHMPMIFPWLVSGEHRQNTCISGDGDGVISVGRLLRVFSPKLVGLTRHKTRLFSRGVGFNMAQSGSTVSKLAEQVHRFVDKLHSPQFRYLEPEWKLVFIWIGANDVFMSKTRVISASFESDLVNAISKLKALVSKAFVCLLTLPDLTRAHVINTEQRRRLIDRKSQLVNTAIYNAASRYGWNDSKDFKVVVQPIPSDALTPAQHAMFVSELDGIHPNIVAQQLFAKCIWNNLWLPPLQKMTSISSVVDAPWKKPGPHEYLQ